MEGILIWLLHHPPTKGQITVRVNERGMVDFMHGDDILTPCFATTQSWDELIVGGLAAARLHNDISRASYAFFGRK